MDNKLDLDPWPEPVDGQALLNEVKGYFVTYPAKIQTLAPLWIMASYFDKALGDLKIHRHALRKMLQAVRPESWEGFLALLQNMVQPRFRSLINQRLAELPGKSAQN